MVLCQFFDEPDYATAFKAIQEKTISHDAMDLYYDYIWDITLLEYLVCILDAFVVSLSWEMAGNFR